MLIKSIALLSLAFAVGMIALLTSGSNEMTYPGDAGHATYVTSNSLEDLAARSSIIAIGTVSTVKPTIRNIHGRDPLDASQPDPNYIGVGSIYQINVERYLKGSGGNYLPVVQFESHITRRQGEMIETRDRVADFPMKQGTRYLLFLRPQGQAPDLLISPAQPSRWVLASGLARMETPADGLEVLFPESKEIDFVARVEAIVSGG